MILGQHPTETVVDECVVFCSRCRSTIRIVKTQRPKLYLCTNRGRTVKDTGQSTTRSALCDPCWDEAIEIVL